MGSANSSGGKPKAKKKTPEVDVDERKERVLHTRVPESLDRHIKSRARGLGLSVSTVVRNVLLNTFGLVEDIVTDSTNLALAISGEEPVRTGSSRRRTNPVTAGTDTVDAILAWQEAVLNVNAVCADCNAVLVKGTRAAVGIGDRLGPRAFLCCPCVKAIGATTEKTERKRRR
jgi:hypothetical protein